MHSSFAAALVAILALPGLSYSQEPLVPVEEPTPPPAPAPTFVLVIARPEASDLYVAARTRIRGDDLLARNPGLLRVEEAAPPYDLGRAAGLGWDSIRRSNLPVARTLDAIHLAVVPEPGSILLVSLSSLLLLRRLRSRTTTSLDGFDPNPR